MCSHFQISQPTIRNDGLVTSDLPCFLFVGLSSLTMVSWFPFAATATIAVSLSLSHCCTAAPRVISACYPLFVLLDHLFHVEQFIIVLMDTCSK